MIKGGNTYRLLTDQLGSVRLVVDATSGAVAQEIEYDPFGRIISDSNEGFQPFGFAGGLYDSATGLTHFGAREYDAGMGRWTTSDPILFSGGDTNLYGYVLADPVNMTDPSGLYWIKEIKYDITHPVNTAKAVGAGIEAIGYTAYNLFTNPISGNQCCPGDGGFLDRWGDSFAKANSIPGIVAPTLSSGPANKFTARNLNTKTVRQFVFSGAKGNPATVARAFAGAYLATGLVWEAGLGIGSALNARYGPC